MYHTALSHGNPNRCRRPPQAAARCDAPSPRGPAAPQDPETLSRLEEQKTLLNQIHELERSLDPGAVADALVTYHEVYDAAIIEGSTALDATLAALRARLRKLQRAHDQKTAAPPGAQVEGAGERAAGPNLLLNPGSVSPVPTLGVSPSEDGRLWVAGSPHARARRLLLLYASVGAHYSFDVLQAEFARADALAADHPVCREAA